MENQKENQNAEVFCLYEKDHKRGKIIGGILVVIAGSLLLARELGADIPSWVFTWKTFLIALGLLVGIKHRFRNLSWLILILAGSVFLISDIYPELVFKHLLWPIVIIVIGLFIIFKPHRHRFRHRNRFAHMHQKRWKEREEYMEEYKKKYENYPFTETSSDDLIEGVTFMGGIKKKIISKDFKGGDITVIFGGVELDFSQADITEKATLEVTQIFGGTKLIVPANWEIKSELVSVFGSIEDKRMVQPTALSNETNKILILRGTTLFGGIEIKSF